jgi:hypothetical protein
MTPRFLFHPAARAELAEAVAWYEAQRPELGEDLGQVTAAALESHGFGRSILALRNAAKKDERSQGCRRHLRV